jgi:hypothetical protein
MIACMLVLSGHAWSFGYFDAISGGSPASAIGAWSAAQGGTRAAYRMDALALFLNPAGLSAQPGFSATVTGGMLWWKEYFDYGILRINAASTLQSNQSIAACIPVGGGFNAGLGVAPVADADYSGRHFIDVPSQTGDGAELERLVSSGTQWEALAGASYSPTGWFSLGFSSGLRTGTLEYQYDHITEEGLLDSSASWQVDISEPVLRGGVQAWGHLVAAGFVYTSAGEKLPAVSSAGVEIRVPQLANVVVGVEGEIRSPLSRNDFMGKLYFRQPLDYRTTLMAGVSFSEFPPERGRGMGFSLGASRRVLMFRVDGGAIWRTRTLEGSYIEGEISDEIDDSSVEFVLGATLL